MARTRIKGRDLSLTIDTEEYNCDATSVVLSNEEGAADDQTTFCEITTGAGVQWNLEVEAVSSFDAGSLWHYCWANSGSTAAFTFSPAGGTGTAATAPQFSGTLEIGPKPSIGGSANNAFTFTKTFKVIGEPLMTPAPVAG